MSALFSKNDQRLAKTVTSFGCPQSSIVSLRNKQKQLPDHVSYLDLLSDQVQEEAGRLPDAVAEFQGKPVMYLIDAESGEPDQTERIDLQQRLANRGDHAVLAIVRPGDLTLYPLNLDRKTLNEKGVGKTIRISDPRAPFLFDEIATGSLKDLEGQPEASDPVFEEIKNLLDRAINDLVIAKGLAGLAVLPMNLGSPMLIINSPDGGEFMVVIKGVGTQAGLVCISARLGRTTRPSCFAKRQSARRLVSSTCSS